MIEPGAAGRGEVAGERVDAVALDRVPVGHQTTVGARARRPRSTDPQHVAGPHAAGQRDARSRAWIVGPSITGSEYGEPTSTMSTPASTIARIASMPPSTVGKPAGR